MYGDRHRPEFINGMHVFLRVAETNKQTNGFICCLWSVCKNRSDHSNSKVLHAHLLRNGFMPGYYCWTKHGEKGVITEDNEEKEDNDNYAMFNEEIDTTMGENKTEKDPIVDEPNDDLRRAIRDAQMDSESENEKMKLERILA